MKTAIGVIERGIWGLAYRWLLTLDAEKHKEVWDSFKTVETSVTDPYWKKADRDWRRHVVTAYLSSPTTSSPAELRSLDGMA